MRTVLGSSLVLALGAILARATPAGAEPVTLRIATAAPDGTAWARLFRAMGRDLQSESNGEVAAHWYFGGIAGDETQMLDRMKRGQLDAVMSGGMLCMKLSPSMRALRLLGLFRSRDEASYVLGRLRPSIDEEMARTGFHNIGEVGLGNDVIFSRVPIRSLAELRRTRLWFWDLDEPMRQQLEVLGVPGVGLPVERAGAAYEARRTDGFIAVPTAALAFQWSAATPYLSALRMAYLPGCMVMTHAAWDAMSVEARRALTTAAAKFQARLEEAGRDQDAALLGGLLARQGVKTVPLAPGQEADFLDAARAARDRLRDKLIPGVLIDRITGWVADYRAEYGRSR